MTPFFVYLIKSTVSLALLYSLFRLAMRNDRMHMLNRFLLLGILLFSAVIPFLNIQFFTKEVVIQPVEKLREFVSTPVIAPETTVAENLPAEEAGNFAFDPYLILYAGIISVLLFRLLVAVIRVLQLIKKAQKQKFRNVVLAVVKELIQPFTFIDKIVLSEKDFNENKDIIVAHEHAHIKYWHAFDLLICELFTLLHFFNPFMWLLRHDLKMVHEYQADQAVLNKGIDAQKYQLLVLEKAVGERRFALANHFTQKPILKRFKMMKKRKKPWTGVKLLFFVPVLILLLQAYARPELITKTDDFVQVKYTENKSEQWLQKWTVENIGKGFWQPALESPDAPKKPNNVLIILMNRKNQFLIENQKAEKEDVKSIVKNYLLGINPDGKQGPDFVEKDIPFVGKMKVSKGSIVYQNDFQSSVEMVNYTLRAIGEACLEVRNNKAQILFGKDYLDLDEGKLEAVNEAVPVWFTIEEPKTVKPPPPPPPINISMKNNGEIVVGKNSYKTFSAFQNKLLEMQNTIEKINKSHGTKYAYKTTLVAEDAVANSEIDRAIQAMENANFNKSNIVVIKDDQTVTKKTPPSSASQTTSEKVDVHLNQNKLYFDGKFCKEEDLKNTVEKYLAENPDIKVVRLILHQPGDLSNDKVAKAKEELNKIKNVEIKVISVAVMEINKKTPPPPPPPKFVVELYNTKIKVNGKEIPGKELGNVATDFLKKVGDKYSVHFDVASDVSNERIKQIKERLFFTGMSLKNFTSNTKN